MIKLVRNLVVLGSIGGAILLGQAQTAKADHGGGNGGYYQGGYAGPRYSHSPGPVYYDRPAYTTHGYSYHHRHYSDSPPSRHVDVSIHTWRPSYRHHGRHHGHHD